MSSLSFEPMSALMGARAHGIDLRRPISPADAQALREAWGRLPAAPVETEKVTRVGHTGRRSADNGRP